MFKVITGAEAGVDFPATLHVDKSGSATSKMVIEHRRAEVSSANTAFLFLNAA